MPITSVFRDHSSLKNIISWCYDSFEHFTVSKFILLQVMGP